MNFKKMNRPRKMKAMIPLAVMVFATTLSTSCDSDDSEPVIEGIWLLTSSSTEEFTNNVSDGTETETVDADNFIRLTFDVDGTFSEFESYSTTDNGEVVVKTFTSTGTYEASFNSDSGNVLSMTYGIDTETFEFTLSQTQLGIEYVEEYTQNGDQKRYVTTETYDRQ
ncbi:hypothetical protein LV716_01255 [Flagellimonas sp. HMM57]|uniref:hypothetical protein n=1 Tax=unclassified Flagellimonas TaxID=2644544 RepID=UPI0013D23F70|nr:MULTISPECIES: hypothetical protein [unclassified Flagellimonas]UII76441.1 hypothetical protein LV716_01255 [Flagellimonas sp. HMM57]